jgi:hypothetical protein
MFEEMRVPNLKCIEEINGAIKKHGLFFHQESFFG